MNLPVQVALLGPVTIPFTANLARNLENQSRGPKSDADRSANVPVIA
jgi:hypothetical protein